MKTEITTEIVSKLIDTVKCGLTPGLGIQKPGKMCTEAAVCYAYGLPHSDNPPCVGDAVRSFKIRLNDSKWSSNKARAKGMIRIAIAQLGSDEIDQNEFAKRVALKTMQIIIADIAKKYLPSVEAELRTVTDIYRGAELCREVGMAAYAAGAAAAASAAAAAAYAAGAYKAASAADAAAAAASAAAAAAYAAGAYKAASAADAGDKVLIQSANLCLDVLIEMNSPGTKFLYLLN